MTFQNFCKQNQTLLQNADAKNVFLFLSQPEHIFSMIQFSNLGLPAISGIAAELEKNFANSNSFSLQLPKNRQTIGKMVKYILSFFSYEVATKGLDERAKLRNFSNCQLFKTAAVYRETNIPPRKKIHCSIY